MTYEELVEISEKQLFIIAEAGVNHNGDVETALRLVDAAVDAGCDAVKFQTWITEKVYCKEKSIKPDYQVRATDAAESEFDTVKKLELSFKDFEQIKSYCDERGISFFSTPDEYESADFLKNLGVDLIKTASQDVTNTPFLKHVAGLGLPVIFSTGACTMSELADGVEAIASRTDELIILHCVSSYPAPVDQMNLAVIPSLKSAFGYPVGFSDHTTGVEVGCAAVALGARVFEKHLTLDRNMSGPDHQASLDPGQMREYCQALRSVRRALGDGVKKIVPCEVDVRKAFRRFVVASRDLSSGTVIGDKDVMFMKTVEGIAPKHLDMIIGAKLTCDVGEGWPLDWSMFSPAVEL